MITTNLDIRNYLMVEGLAYRLVPVSTPKQENGRVNIEVMYDNLMNKFAFRGMDNPDLYYNEEYQKFAMNTRQTFYRLADAIFQRENNKQRAQEVVQKAWTSIPDKVFPFNVYSAQYLPLFFQIEMENTEEYAYIMGDRAIEVVDYMVSEGIKNQQEIQSNLYMLSVVSRSLEQYVGKEAAEKYQTALQNFSAMNI
jgi:hypothetical protein